MLYIINILIIMPPPTASLHIKDRLMSKAPKSYDRVLIIGPHFDASVIESTRQAWRKAGVHFAIVGDGEGVINPITLHGVLNAISAYTRVHILAHGGVESSAAGESHVVELFSLPVPTADFITQYLAHSPCIVHVWSCYAGAARDGLCEENIRNPVILHGTRKREVLIKDVHLQELVSNGRGAEGVYSDVMHSLKEGRELTVVCRQKSYKAGPPKNDFSPDAIQRQFALHHQRLEQLLGEPIRPLPVDEALKQHYPEKVFNLKLRLGYVNVPHYVEDWANRPNAKGLTPLYVACSKGHRETVKMLLLNGADVNAPSAKDGRALHSILRKRMIWPDMHAAYEEIGLLLIQHGADLDAAFDYLCSGGRRSSAEWLLNNSKGYLPPVDTLLQRVLEMTETSSERPKDKGRSIMVLSIGRSLIKHGANVDVALEYACRRGFALSVSWLVGRGADVNAPNAKGLLPLQAVLEMMVASPDKREAYEKIGAVLVKHGAVIDRPRLAERVLLEGIMKRCAEQDHPAQSSILVRCNAPSTFSGR